MLAFLYTQTVHCRDHLHYIFSVFCVCIIFFSVAYGMCLATHKYLLAQLMVGDTFIGSREEQRTRKLHQSIEIRGGGCMGVNIPISFHADRSSKRTVRLNNAIVHTPHLVVACMIGHEMGVAHALCDC